MNCTSCGAQLDVNERFCSVCGAAVPDCTPSRVEYVPAVPLLNSTPILVFGILALAFACTFYLSFLGIIFGAIACSKASGFAAQGGIIAGKAKAGKILGTIGLILSIILTVVLVIFVVMLASYSYALY